MRHFVVPAMVTLASYSIGFMFGARTIPIWLILIGGGAWLLADLGTALLADYSDFRENPMTKTFSQKLGNPLLSLKGGWALFLVAFLFVLIGFLSLGERGWFLPIFSALGLGARYGLINTLRHWRWLRLCLAAMGFVALPFLSSFGLSRF